MSTTRTRSKRKIVSKAPKSKSSNSSKSKLSSSSKSTKLDIEEKEEEIEESLKAFLEDESHNQNENNDKGEGSSESKRDESSCTKLTLAQKAQMEVNRQNALLIRQEKLNKRKYFEKPEKKSEKEKFIQINDTKLIDTGGGFFVEEKQNDLTESDVIAAMHVVTDPPPLLKEDMPFCTECKQPFDNSYLYHNFNETICDGCRDREDKHSLITKTDAKVNYLLKDVDFDKRPPPLLYILRKNPHNSNWGDMKLYLKLQVEKRALEVWGTEEAIEEAIENQEEKREVTKQKKYRKKMKELRMSVRSSLYTRATKTHEHEYGDELYHSDDDEYSKTCSSCGHTYKYDKM